jgi:hypothetical protein
MKPILNDDPTIMLKVEWEVEVASVEGVVLTNKWEPTNTWKDRIKKYLDQGYDYVETADGMIKVVYIDDAEYICLRKESPC